MKPALKIMIGILCLSFSVSTAATIFVYWAWNYNLTEMEVFLKFCLAWPMMILLAGTGVALLSNTKKTTNA